MSKICKKISKVHLTETNRVYQPNRTAQIQYHDLEVCDEENCSEAPLYATDISLGGYEAGTYNSRVSRSFSQTRRVQDSCSQTTEVLKDPSARKIKVKCTSSQAQQQDQNVCCTRYNTRSSMNVAKYVNVNYGRVKVQVKSSQEKSNESWQRNTRYNTRSSMNIAKFVNVNHRRVKAQMKSFPEKSIESWQRSIISSREKVRRPEHHVVGFLEDHAEFLSDCFEAEDETGKYTPSILESTVDGSIVRGARRSYGSRISSNDLDFFINTAIKNGSSDQDPLISLDEWGLKTESHKYKCSLCSFTSRMRANVENHIVKAADAHRGAVVVVLLGDHARGRICPICNLKLRGRQLFKHIRACHGSSFPLRCGYCVFLGQDYNQLRHHIKKKHNTSEYKIIDIPRILAEVDQDEQPEPSEDTEVGSGQKDEKNVTSWHQEFQCPVCQMVLKTFSNLKKHLVKHGRKKKQCLLCSFITTFPAQIRSHYLRKHPSHIPKWRTTVVEEGFNGAVVSDVTPFMKLITAKYGVRQPNKDNRWIRQYRCPHCDYTCSFNSSYNRHLRVHKGIKPFKCGYCHFHAREAYVVRNHSRKEHKGKKPVVESGKTFKAPYRFELRKQTERQNWDNHHKESDQEDLNKNSGIGHSLPSESPDQEEVQSKFLSKTILSQRWGLNPHQHNYSNCENTVEQNKSETIVKEKTADENTNTEMKVAEIRIDCQHEVNSSINNVCESSAPRLKLYLKDSIPYSKNVCEINNSSTKDTNEACKLQQIQRINKSESVEPCSLSSVMKSYCSCEDDIESPSNRSQFLKQIAVHKEYLSSKEGLTAKLKELKGKYVDDEYRLLQNCKKLTTQQSKTEQETSSSDRDIGCQIILSDIDIDSPKNDVFIQLDTYNNGNILLPTIMCSQECVTEENFSFKKDQLDSTSCSSTTAADKLDNTKLHPKSLKDNGEERTGSSQTVFLNGGLPNTYVVAGDDSCDRSQQEISETKTKENCKRVSQTNQKSKVSVTRKKVNTVSSKTEDKLKYEKNNGQTVGVGETGLENNLHTHIAFLADSRLNTATSPVPDAKAKSLLHPGYTSNDYFSLEKIRSMMKKKKNGQITCNECGATTSHRAFYKHAKKHFNMKPFKCGYCSYRSIEKSKIRVHNTFCHSESPCIILMLSPEEAAVPATQNITKRLNINTSKSKGKMWSPVNNENLVAIQKNKNSANNQPHESNNGALTGTVTTSKLMQEASKVRRSRRKNDNAVQKISHVVTEYCVSEPDDKINSCSSRLSLYQCSLCLKLMQKHTPSIRRHLYTHYGYKPFKCGYCSFTGSGQTEVRAHHATHGCTTPPRVEPTGDPMPENLALLIKKVTSHHQAGHRSQRRRRTQASQQAPGVSYKQPLSKEFDPNLKTGCSGTPTDSAVMYLTPRKDSEQTLVSANDHTPFESTVADQCSISRPMENEALASETEYAVQTLESDGITSGCLPSHFGFSMDTEAHSDISSNPVCVVCFIE